MRQFVPFFIEQHQTQLKTIWKLVKEEPKKNIHDNFEPLPEFLEHHKVEMLRIGSQ